MQINNWNEYNKNHDLAVKYLKNVQTDLARDTSVFSSTLVTIEQIKDFKAWGLQQQDFSTIDVNYLSALISQKYFNIQSNDQAFQRMNDPNVMNIIEFDSVFMAINSYYTFNQDYLNCFNEWDKESSLKESDYWNLQGINEINFSSPQDSIPIIQDPEIRKQRLEDRILSLEGRNYIKMSLLRVSTIEGIYKRQLETAKRLITRIEKALESI
ncbi:MAG: hypothetical protein JJ895_00790 [Balneolaceae bacterium]|nr:hypothetical protein [Balneolaceae bacterium]